MKYHVVIDLEMCHVPKVTSKKRYPYSHEIIQIGAVMMDDSYEIIDMFESFVCPEFGKIDNFINNLTGIREVQVKTAPVLKDALLKFTNWIGNRNVTVYAWSSTDRGQLMKELKTKNIAALSIDGLMSEERWVDYQAVFTERFDLDHIPSLSDALDAADIDAEGPAHDGLADAYNTALLISKLERDPNYKLRINEWKQGREESASFGFSLSDMLGNLAVLSA